LDGGASSALYLNGKYITYPGRLLNNVLVFVRK
ncbi:phosphodiester glycosidase family protein, partial [bacterium]|nr:phosphodiester glycosidase family protein [bacterium]